MSKTKKPKTLAEVQAEIKDVQDEFVNSIPFNAWRFFTPELARVQFHDGQMSFDDADYFDALDLDFRECLEFWVTQAGGKVTWKMPKTPKKKHNT